MDQRTLDFYNSHALEMADKYNAAESPLLSLAPLLFKSGQRVLDAGCGSGRDMDVLRQLGLDVYGLEPSGALLEQAVLSFPELKGRIFEGGLPGVPANLPGPFDGIILSAVIMHIPDELLFETAYALKGLLKPGGLLVISHCTKRDTGLVDGREENGRLFVLRSSERIQLLFEELGFEKRHVFMRNDGLGREGVEWETVVLDYRGSAHSESVDRIERIINQDRKTATYKLALLRSLCDIAQRKTQCAFWTVEGRVKVTLKEISRKWAEYYLPVMGYNQFVPNNRGESPGSQKPIAFRSLLTELSKFYPSTPQGQAQFLEDRDKHTLPAEAAGIYKQALSKIDTAIKNGPVVYSSGNSFEYHKEDKTISMEGALWREMVLLGHWIEDSLIMKWAQLIHEFSLTTREFPVNRALDILMMQPDYDRRVGPAKSVYTTQKELNCVWSGKKITHKNLAIDHAIPFSLRHDNSLWNLVPADDRVNLSKSDKLPTTAQLQKSRDGLISNWQMMYGRQKELFSSSIVQFMGVKRLSMKSWEIDLFRCFFETVELTASRRGIERWEC